MPFRISSTCSCATVRFRSAGRAFSLAVRTWEGSMRNSSLQGRGGASRWSLPDWSHLHRMEVHFTPEQEAELAKVAANQRRRHRGVREERRTAKMLSTKPSILPPFKRVSMKPIAANSSKRKRWTDASRRCCGVSENSLDALPRRPTWQRLAIILQESLPAYRDRTINRIYSGVRDLKRFPYRGPRGKRPGTRELVFPRLPYIVIY